MLPFLIPIIAFLTSPIVEAGGTLLGVIPGAVKLVHGWRTGKPKDAVARVTAYGWYDNEPPSDYITFPVLHKEAGGAGTFLDPITFAGNPNVFSKGQKIYINFYRKYFIMEDLSSAAMKRTKTMLPLIDMWIGGDGTWKKEDLQAKAANLSHETEAIVINPPDGLEVDLTPLLQL